MDGFEYEGKTYVAKDSDDQCKGCVATPGSRLCQKMPPCGAKGRADNRYIIWVEESE